MIPTGTGSIFPTLPPPTFPGTDFANNILNTMQTAASGWVPTVLATAQKLFLDLAGLEVVWSTGEFILQRAQTGWEGLAIATAKRILQLSLFYWIVSNANSIFWLIYNLFQSVGSGMTGISMLSPGTILQNGINFTALISENVSTLGLLSHPFGAFVLAFSNLLILLSFVVVAGQFMVTIVESYIASSAGILLLGFAGSRWTATFADKYFAYAIGIGIKLLMCFVVISLGENITLKLNQIMATPGFFPSVFSPNFAPTLYSNLFELVGISLIYAFMAWYIPQLASSLASGSVGMTLGAFAATGASLVGSMFAAGKLGSSAVMTGTSLLKNATSTGAGSPLPGSSLFSSRAPSYVSPPSSAGAGTNASTSFSGNGASSPGGIPSPPPATSGTDVQPSPPASGGTSGAPGQRASPPGSGARTAPVFSSPAGAPSGSVPSSSPGSGSGIGQAPSMPSDKADVSPGGPQFRHGDGE